MSHHPTKTTDLKDPDSGRALKDSGGVKHVCVLLNLPLFLDSSTAR